MTEKKKKLKKEGKDSRIEEDDPQKYVSFTYTLEIFSINVVD